MKILILMNSSDGLYLFRKELIERLVEEYEVYFAGPDDGYVEELEKIGASYIPLYFNRHGMNPISEISLLFKYCQTLKKIQPSAVLTYTIKPNIYGGVACTLQGIPYITNITGLGTAVEYPGIKQRISLFLYRLGLRKSSMVFFQNSENRDFMLNKKVILGPYDLLPGSGVNLKKFKVEKYPDDEEINFVFISRLMKEKGIDQYLDAAKVIHTKYPNTVFNVCGPIESEYDRSKLDELISSKTIIYHGIVKDVNAIHKFSNCTIHPTYYPEGLSNVLLESCACGRPIITTNRSGCREVLEDGVNGLCIKEKDSNDLIAKIEQFLAMSSADKKKMGLAGRYKVEKEFDRQIVVNKYISLLQKLLVF